jgi:hypothetical protein
MRGGAAENGIELALKQEEFVRDRGYFSFASGVEEVATKKSKVMQALKLPMVIPVVHVSGNLLEERGSGLTGARAEP